MLMPGIKILYIYSLKVLLMDGWIYMYAYWFKSVRSLRACGRGASSAAS